MCPGNKGAVDAVGEGRRHGDVASCLQHGYCDGVGVARDCLQVAYGGIVDI